MNKSKKKNETVEMLVEIHKCNCDKSDVSVIRFQHIDGGIGVMCLNCLRRTPIYQGILEAAATWNEWIEREVE